MSKFWYALHVASNCERAVAARLAYAGVDGFYPHVLQASKDGRREVETKFMPGYVFGNFDIADKGEVVSIPHVVSILGWGPSRPVAIPDSEIEGVRKIVSVPELARPSAFISAGDRVLVRRGPLTGLEGFVAHVKNATRVVVSVSMLGRSVAADVEASWLENLERRMAAKAA